MGETEPRNHSDELNIEHRHTNHFYGRLNTDITTPPPPFVHIYESASLSCYFVRLTLSLSGQDQGGVSNHRRHQHGQLPVCRRLGRSERRYSTQAERCARDVLGGSPREGSLLFTQSSFCTRTAFALGAAVVLASGPLISFTVFTQEHIAVFHSRDQCLV